MPLRASFKRWAMTTTSSRAAGDFAEPPESTGSATAMALTTRKLKAAAALGAAARTENLNMERTPQKAEWIATAPIARAGHCSRQSFSSRSEGRGCAVAERRHRSPNSAALKCAQERREPGAGHKMHD